MLDLKIQKVLGLILSDTFLKRSYDLDTLTKTQLNRDLIQLVLKAGELLHSRKHLETLKASLIADDCRVASVRQRHSYQLMRFSSYLAFETHQTVTLKRIEKGNMKYSRCQKALNDNSKESFFTKDPVLS